MSRPIRLVALRLMLFLVAECRSADGAKNQPARSDEIEALIDGYLASWEAKDEQALRASDVSTNRNSGTVMPSV